MGDNKAGSNSKIRTETDLRNELKNSLATDEFKEKHIKLQQNYKRKYGQMIWAEKITQANCSTKVQEQDPRYYTWAPLPSPTCSKRVEINFENDSDKITSKNMGLLIGSDNYKWLKSCIEKYKMKNLKVKNIRIDGSANRFTGKNKPGEMSEAVAYNKDLALRRAKSTEANVLESLIGNDLYSEYKDSGKKTSITAKGEHGDGTSGPCPYTTKIDTNGRYSLKPEFKDKDSLRKYRYANIVVTFEDLKAAPQTAAQKAKKVRESHAVVGCKSYTISCKK